MRYQTFGRNAEYLTPLWTPVRPLRVMNVVRVQGARKENLQMKNQPEARKLRGAYDDQRTNAKKRAVPFLLTFEQWLKIWVDSGNLNLRGCRRGQYVMARIGDEGSYIIGNVRIIRMEDNQSERWTRGGERKRMRDINLGVSNPMYGRKHSYEAGAKISASISALYAKRLSET